MQTNESVKLVAGALTGSRYKMVVLGGKGYVIKPLVIKTICYVAQEFAHIGFDSSKRLLDLVPAIPEIAPYLLKGIAYAIAGNVPEPEKEAERIYTDLQQATTAELQEAFSVVMDFIGARDFFACATSAAEVAKITARSV